MGYFHATLVLEHETKMYGEAGRKKAKEAYDEALKKLMGWAVHRDDVRWKPHPLEAAWAFRQRAFDEQRENAIQALERVIRDLKNQRPRGFEAPVTDRPSGYEEPPQLKSASPPSSDEPSVTR